MKCRRSFVNIKCGTTTTMPSIWYRLSIFLLVTTGHFIASSYATPVNHKDLASFPLALVGKRTLTDSLSKLKFQKPDIQGAELLKLNADTGLCLSLPTIFHRNVVFTTCSTRGRDDDLRSLWQTIPLNNIVAKTNNTVLPASPYVQIRNLQNGLCLTFHRADHHVMTDECEYQADGEPVHSQLFRFHQPSDKKNGESKLISAESDDTDDNHYDCLRSGRSYHDDIATLNNISFLNALIETCDHNQRWQYIQRRPVHNVASSSSNTNSHENAIV
ncbi:hypothetical protein BDF22DRAFT_697980 [Syncephalis plumigaleata]|nr:hypothetical protein BDF22DRAFT_697980 [Syncephalis plumigaleata]